MSPASISGGGKLLTGGAFWLLPVVVREIIAQMIMTCNIICNEI